MAGAEQSTAHASLKERLAERERILRETGCYEPEMKLKSEDPIKFELMYTKVVQSVLNARDVGKLVSASPVVREIGESVFGLYTPEGDAIALSPGLMIHVHTMSRMIKWMIEHDYETDVGIREGDYFFNNDPFIGGAHGPDQAILTPIYHEGKLVGWAGGLTHVPETGAVEPGGMPISGASRFAEGLFLPCVKIAENEELKKDLEILVDRSVRTSVWWLLDNRAKIAGCRIIRDGVKRLMADYGPGYYLQAVREYVEDSLRATREKIRRTLFPGRYRDVFWRGVNMPHFESLLHSPAEVTVSRDGHISIDVEGVAAAGPHPFQATLPAFEGIVFNGLVQYLLYDTRYNEGSFYAVDLKVPKGSACDPPDIFHATALWGPAFACGKAAGAALSRAWYAAGYREECHAGPAMVNSYVAGGKDMYGRSFGGFNMELTACGMSATGCMDGLDTALAEFNAEGDMGDAEVWEQALPPIYLGRSLHRDGGGFGRYRGGNGIYSLYMVPPGADHLEMGSFGAAPIFPTQGMMGGYPAPCHYISVMRNTNLKELIEKRLPLPHREGDPAHPEIEQLVQGKVEHVAGGNYVSRAIKPYDLYVQINGDAGGFGDPIDRDPKLVARDLRNGATSLETARKIHCVAVDPESFAIDVAETTRLRQERRELRKRRGVPAREYIARERETITGGQIPGPSLAMYRDVLSRNPRWTAEYREFWGLPDDFMP